MISFLRKKFHHIVVIAYVINVLLIENMRRNANDKK